MPIPHRIHDRVFNHPLINTLTPTEKDVLIHQLSYQELSRGDMIFEEDELGSNCYLIIEGTVVVSKKLASGTEQTLATLGFGEVLGQIALIDHKPRSATCRIGSDQALLVYFDDEVFERLYSSQNPFAYKVLDYVVTSLSKRLRNANQQLSKARGASQEQQHRLSLKAAQVIAGHNYTDEELDSIEVIKTDFEEAIKYNR